MRDIYPRRSDWTGAEAILDPDNMLGAQEQILRRIILHVYDIAESEAGQELTEGASLYQQRQLGRRPHRVFLIDGARGSGKTTLLLTVQRYLGYLGRPEKWSTPEPDAVQGFLADYARRIDAEVSAVQHADLGISGRFRMRHKLATCERRTAYYLPVLFPSDLEFGQSIMEGLIALVAKMLDEEIARCGDAPASREKRTAAEKLRNRLNQEVAQGWFLSRNAGHDAILRDSADYNDFLKIRGEANVASFDRVPVWRAFVNDFLDFFGAELLAVFFDDTDVATNVSRDILHTIRIFLDHPRIVTIIAGNLRSIRQNLVLDEMKTLGAPIGALTQETEATAREWRRFVRQEIEESLEKVLPRQYRYYIMTAQERGDAQIERRPSGSTIDQTKALVSTHPPELAGAVGRDSDFQRVFGCTFDKLCGTMLDRWRDDFLQMRQKSHFRYLEDRQEIWRDDEEGKLENFLSWWLFRHYYADQLIPRTVRHMAALRAYTLYHPDADRIVDRLPSEHKKRLAVVLFESPDNHEIIHRLGDSDHRVLSWLRRQTIEASWNGERYIAINGRRIYEKTFSYHFVLYRLDLGIALPVQENPDETLPRGLLPVPSGPNLINHRPFFRRNRRQRLFGVASDLNHTAIPANCIFLSDADSLPDAAWKASSETESQWEHRLIYQWPKMFFFDLDEMKAAEGEATRERIKDVDAGDMDESWSNEYFVRTVLPLAAMAVGRFVGSADAFDEYRPKALQTAADKSLLMAELRHDRPFFGRLLGQIDNLMRRYDYIEHIARGPGSRGVTPLAEDALAHWCSAILDGVFPENQITPKLAESGSDAALGRQVLSLWNSLRGLPRRPSNEVPQADISNPDDSAALLRERQELSSQLVSYQWLVNDVRRAWHAARIFLNQVSGPLKKYSSTDHLEHDKPTREASPEVTRKDRFFREDRYTIGTRVALDRWLKRSNTLIEFGKPFLLEGSPPPGVIQGTVDRLWRVDPAAERRLVRQCFRDTVDTVDAALAQDLSLDGDDFLVNAAQLGAFLRARENATRVGVQWPFLLDPAQHDRSNGAGRGALGDKPKVDQGTEAKQRRADEKGRTFGRIARSYLLFLYGIVPTLPSLIHIELAGVMKNFVEFDDQGRRRKCNAVLLDWDVRVKNFISFIYQYRRLLELSKTRLDIMQLWQDAHGDNARPALKNLGIEGPNTPETFGAWMTLTPDMSFASVGVSGISNLHGLQFTGDVLQLLNAQFTHRKDQWTVTAERPGRVVWQPIISDSLLHLVEALNFIEVMRHVVTPTASGSRS